MKAAHVGDLFFKQTDFLKRPDDGVRVTDTPAFRERFATRYAYFRLMRLFVRDAFTVGPNDVRDFFHTVVPVAHANIVVLDKRWHAQVEKLKLPPRFMRCFKEGTMNDFFDVLEACSAAQN